VEKFVHPSDRHFHGIDGFCDFPFPADPVDDPDNPVIRTDEPAAVAMVKLVQKFPGNFWIFIFNKFDFEVVGTTLLKLNRFYICPAFYNFLPIKL
jgi:hypothetical protein